MPSSEAHWHLVIKNFVLRDLRFCHIPLGHDNPFLEGSSSAQSIQTDPNLLDCRGYPLDNDNRVVGGLSAVCLHSNGTQRIKLDRAISLITMT